MSDQGQSQYASVNQLVHGSNRTLGGARWMSGEDRERLAAYDKYEQIYWSRPEAFQVMRRGVEMKPLTLPNAMTTCDETAHFFMRNMTFTGKDRTLERFLEPWIKKTRWMSRFLVNKHAGVVRGDWVFHLVADEDAEDGKKVQIVSIDPARFFPAFDDADDIDKLTSVSLAEQFTDFDKKIRIRKLTYTPITVGSNRRVTVQEAIYESDERAWAQGNPPVNRVLTPETLMPPHVTHIPVYHFKNRDWQGDIFGSSELRGHERLLSSISQEISDTELAVALEGMGVYYTDAGSPIDQNTGKAVSWVIAPGQVLEIPTGTTFGRVPGLKDLDPAETFLEMLTNGLYEGAGVANLGKIDVAFAQDADAMVVKFQPTLAKLEERETSCIEGILEMFQDWMQWYSYFEKEDVEDDSLGVELGDKLPLNRAAITTELNNMLDRDAISRAEYRRQMKKKLGYEFAAEDKLKQEIIDEQEELSKFQIKGGPFGWPGIDPATGAPTDANGNPVSNNTGQMLNGNFPGKPDKSGSTLPRGNASNNSAKPNESRGTEPTQTGAKQQKVRPR